MTAPRMTPAQVAAMGGRAVVRQRGRGHMAAIARDAWARGVMTPKVKARGFDELMKTTTGRRRYARILRELTGEAAGDRVTTPERDER